VRITGLSATAFALPLRQPLHLAGGTLTRRCGVLLEIVADDGGRGVGEAALREDTDSAAARSLADKLTALTLEQRRGHIDLDLLASHLPVSLRCGLEMALLDLEARHRTTRLADHLGTARREEVRLNALIGRLSPDDTAAAAAAAVAAGFTCLKIKADPRDTTGALAVLRAARAAVGAETAIRIDANTGWSVEQAATFLAHVGTLGIEYVEQPVATLAEMSLLRSRVTIPLAADEAIDGPDTVRAAADAVDVVVIKPTRIGLRRAVAAIAAARDAGLGVVLSSNLDSAFGITAALHLSALLPEPARACGLATAALWQSDLIAAPPLAEKGMLRLPSGAGLGIEIDRARLADMSIQP